VPSQPAGIAFVNQLSKSGFELWPSGVSISLFFLRQGLRTDAGRAGWSEDSVELVAYLIPEEGDPVEINGHERSQLVRLLSSSIRVKDPRSIVVRADLVGIESELVSKLRIPSDEDIEKSVRYAVWPFAAVAVVP